MAVVFVCFGIVLYSSTLKNVLMLINILMISHIYIFKLQQNAAHSVLND